MTIVEAIKAILRNNAEGITSREIYDQIINKKLYDFPAENPAAVVNGMIRRHCIDLDFPTASPVKHFKIIGYQGKKPLYALIESDIERAGNEKQINHKELLPEEILQTAYEKHISYLRDTLRDTIMKNSPSFFEQLIVDLLIAMGYGYDKSSGIVVGGAHDGGIDGIIFEDKLGLDQIYLQAKRYKMGNSVSRKELQAFVGAMQNVHKGVFISTSTFTREAIEYAKCQQQKSLKLIDGMMLADLMVKHEVGIVRTAKPLILYKIDSSYFN